MPFCLGVAALLRMSALPGMLSVFRVPVLLGAMLAGRLGHSLVHLEKTGRGIGHAKSRQPCQNRTARQGRGIGTERTAVILHDPFLCRWLRVTPAFSPSFF
jgi:hypothetical protein